MKHKLNFVKITPNHEFAGVGFAGNIFIILNALMYIDSGDKLFVDMETNECACTENEVIHGTNNCWEYYFNQTTITNGEVINQMNSLIPAKINYDDRDLFMDPKKFITLKEKFFNSFELKPYLTELLNDYYVKNIEGKVTLGMQIRLTDMKHYHNVSSVDKYIEKVKIILKDKPDIEQIFLATDDGSIIESVRESLNVPVICYEDMFRADINNPQIHPYDRFKFDREQHRYKLGIECIQEIFTLSKCDYLFKADISSVSIVASILSDNIKQIFRL